YNGTTGPRACRSYKRSHAPGANPPSRAEAQHPSARHLRNAAGPDSGRAGRLGSRFAVKLAPDPSDAPRGPVSLPPSRRLPDARPAAALRLDDRPRPAPRARPPGRPVPHPELPGRGPDAPGRAAVRPDGRAVPQAQSDRVARAGDAALAAAVPAESRPGDG